MPFNLIFAPLHCTECYEVFVFLKEKIKAQLSLVSVEAFKALITAK